MTDFRFEAWPTEFRSINQYFGANPQNYAQFGLPGHEGIDIMAPTGSRIFAVAAGTVRMVRAAPTGHNYGIHVRIDHVDGYQTIYAHLKELSVDKGDSVQAGALLGLADNTGNSFGSHLHLTLKKKGASQGRWPSGIIDPTPYVLPLMGWKEGAGPYVEGWVYSAGIFGIGELAQVSSGGVNLREAPHVGANLIGLIPAGTIVAITGKARGSYTPVRASQATFQESGSGVSKPEPEPPPKPGTGLIDGWGWADYVDEIGEQGVVGQYGINLRTKPTRTAPNIGLVRGGSTVSVTGRQSGEYLPLRVKLNDFSGPIKLPESEASSPPATKPPADGILGWAFTQNLTITGNRAISGRFGTNLRSRPSRTAPNIGLFQEGAAAVVAGSSLGEYTPVIAKPSDVSDRPPSPPPVEKPRPFPDDEPVPPPPEPTHDTTPGWVFSGQIKVEGGMAIAGQFGINLRDAPRRDATNVGFIPAGVTMVVTGLPRGEYTPVRVDDEHVEAPFSSTAVIDTTTPPTTVDPEPQLLGHARIGLHASADPDIRDDEVAEFAAMRPGLIKILSHHDPAGIRKLVHNHPEATWIVRTFLDFGGRNVSPEQFLQWTISNVKRALALLESKDVVIELHNETNLVMEGLGNSWHDGASFANWFLELLTLYRQELPGHKFIYPGLSPGSAVSGIKQDHVQFLEASRAAVEAADGLGVHLYWSQAAPMALALNVLDDYVGRFRFKPIWVTEASNNKKGSPSLKGRQYLKFWKELQKRPTVQGVTYFVASSINPQFAEEVWVGRGIGAVVGRR
jgi:hypothetical protein